MRCYDDGSTAIAVVTKRLIAKRAQRKKMSNLSSFLRSIEGVEIAVLLREQDEGRWKISCGPACRRCFEDLCGTRGGGHKGVAALLRYPGRGDEAIIRSIDEKARCNGILIVDNLPGQFHGVVVKLRRLLERRIGHGDTLDPITGLLPVLMGPGQTTDF